MYVREGYSCGRGGGGMVVRVLKRSDACVGESSGLGEDDDASLAGDVAFH